MPAASVRVKMQREGTRRPAASRQFPSWEKRGTKPFSLDRRGLALDISFGCGGKPAAAWQTHPRKPHDIDHFIRSIRLATPRVHRGYEPTPGPTRGGEQSFGRALPVPLLGGVRGGLVHEQRSRVQSAGTGTLRSSVRARRTLPTVLRSASDHSRQNQRLVGNSGNPGRRLQGIRPYERPDRRAVHGFPF